jgi:hypothetical protein
MMEEPCCEAMAEILKRYDGPFYYPIYIDKETHDLMSGKLAVKVYRLTKSKKAIASGSSASMFLNFCPICGKKLDVPNPAATVPDGMRSDKRKENYG